MAAGSSKKTYEVVTAERETVTVEADKVVENETSAQVKFYLDGEPVGSFRGYNSFRIKN